MNDLDVVIRGGTLVDGTRSERRDADVGIRDGVVAEIGDIRSDRAELAVDASGCVVAPGFVDLHTHYDAQLFWDPYCTISGWHGVTSVVIGNCGFGFAPVAPELREHAMRTMTRNEAISFEAMRSGMPWDWETFPDFLDSVERTPKAVNVVSYVPLNPLLWRVLGVERAKAGATPTADELDAMRALLGEAMDAGACGWSAQRMPPSGGLSTQMDFDGSPMATDVMSDDTCLALAAVLRDRGEGFIQMTLKSGDLAHDREHFEALAAVSGRPVLFNTLGAVERAPEAHRDTIRWLEDCRRRGLQVRGQAITSMFGLTFTLEHFNLFDDSPAWRDVTLGTVAERLAKMRDPARRAALRRERPTAATAGIEHVVLVEGRSDRSRAFESMSMAELGARFGCDPVDAMLDIAVGDELRAVFHVDAASTSVELVRDIVDYEWAIPGISDGGAHTKFLTGGRYPTEFLVEFVRDRPFISLEDAHWRLSALPAACAGFEGRGTLQPGAPADVLVYDLDELAVLPQEVVHDLPGGDWRRVQRAVGYRHVLVNGEPTVLDGQETAARPGRLLRHGR